MKPACLSLKTILFTPFILLASICLTSTSFADDIPRQSDLRDALKKIVAEGNGGFDLNMWATIVDRDGRVRRVAFSGGDRGDQWPGSRVISAQKANTANAFSLPTTTRWSIKRSAA